MKTYPHVLFETDYWNNNSLVCGIDEVGRGAFAGPLVVGAVILKPIKKQNETALSELLSFGINDSKLLKNDEREMVLKSVQEFILFQCTQYISIDIINEKGIGFSNKEGFNSAAKQMKIKVKNSDLYFLTDAFKIQAIDKQHQKNIIRGDSTSVSIALASIIAKVERDRYMEKLKESFPQYGFEKHKGYGTLLHRMNLKKYGPSPHHRTEFIKHYI